MTKANIPNDKELFAEYHVDGYYLAKGLISIEEVEKLKDEIARIYREHPDKIVKEKSPNDESKDMDHKIYNFLDVSPFVSKLAEDARIIGMANKLTGWDSILCTDKINLKLPGARGFYPHQDMSGVWSLHMSNIISVFIAIDKADQQNGCLKVAPGWHSQGVLGGYMGPINDEALNEMQFIPIDQNPGDVIFFDGYLPHKSDPNNSERSRRTLLFSYNKASEGNFRSLFTGNM